MGQQQLLLLVLGIVIVSLGVLAGLSSYDQQRKKSEADTVLNRSLIVAQAAIEWRTRDTVYGGGGGGTYEDIQGKSIEALGLLPSAVRTQIALGGDDAETIEIIGVSLTDPEIGARVVVRGSYITSSTVRVDSTILHP